jgi:hypothetical protein
MPVAGFPTCPLSPGGVRPSMEARGIPGVASAHLTSRVGMLRAPHWLKSARLRHAGARHMVELASVFDASVGSVVVEGCNGVSEN